MRQQQQQMHKQQWQLDQYLVLSLACEMHKMRSFTDAQDEVATEWQATEQAASL
jgi:hypothetical protein